MLARILNRDLEPALAEAGHHLLGSYETDPTPNNFPRLPIRTDTAPRLVHDQSPASSDRSSNPQRQ